MGLDTRLVLTSFACSHGAESSDHVEIGTGITCRAPRSCHPLRATPWPWQRHIDIRDPPMGLKYYQSTRAPSVVKNTPAGNKLGATRRRLLVGFVFATPHGRPRFHDLVRQSQKAASESVNQTHYTMCQRHSGALDHSFSAAGKNNATPVNEAHMEPQAWQARIDGLVQNHPVFGHNVLVGLSC